MGAYPVVQWSMLSNRQWCGDVKLCYYKHSDPKHQEKL